MDSLRKIKHARFLRAIETEDSLTAEVEFALDNEAGAVMLSGRTVVPEPGRRDGETPDGKASFGAAMLADGRMEVAGSLGDLPHQGETTYTAILKKDGDSDYRLERVILNGGAGKGGGNPAGDGSGEAGRDVTEEWFSGSDGTSGEREQFVRDVLGFEGVEEDMKGRPKGSH